jgi:3-methyladenine DNA glycosylase AlkD
MKTSELAEFVSQSLAARADARNAAPMQAYMKTTMPFYGVKKPDRAPIEREMAKRYVPTTQKEYEAGVLALWGLAHREEKYCALAFAVRHKQFVAPASIPLYERLIREGQWWDLVDEVATHLVGRVLLSHRAEVKRTLYAWWKDEDVWVRRTVLSGLSVREAARGVSAATASRTRSRKVDR